MNKRLVLFAYALVSMQASPLSVTYGQWSSTQEEIILNEGRPQDQRITTTSHRNEDLNSIQIRLFNRPFNPPVQSATLYPAQHIQVDPCITYPRDLWCQFKNKEQHPKPATISVNGNSLSDSERVIRISTVGTITWEAGIITLKDSPARSISNSYNNVAFHLRDTIPNLITSTSPLINLSNVKARITPTPYFTHLQETCPANATIRHDPICPLKD